MASFATFSVTLTLLLVTLTIFNVTDARRVLQCKPCRGFGDCGGEPTAYCAYGEYMDECGRYQCAKGPGERCGGPYGVLGKCGDGMMCSDDICKGCSIVDLKCHEQQL